MSRNIQDREGGDGRANRAALPGLPTQQHIDVQLVTSLLAQLAVESLIDQRVDDQHPASDHRQRQAA